MNVRPNLEEEMLGRPVRSLQYMLRRLATQYKYLPKIIDSGRFDENTLEGVMTFQREQFPPWEAIRSEWMDIEGFEGTPRPLRAFPEGGYQITPGTTGDYLLLPQTMFQILAGHINGIEDAVPTEIHEGAAVRNVEWLQDKAMMPVNGVLDPMTWDRLVRLYEVIITSKVPKPGHSFG